MGSCDGYSLCPQCGSIMVYNCWYHSNSYIYNCDICGFYGRKMIYYEDCLDRNSDGVDIDGYSRSIRIGHGVVRNRNCFVRIKTADDQVIPVDKNNVLCYETYVKDGQLKKIRLTQPGLNTLPGIYMVIKKDGTKRLVKDPFIRVSVDEIRSVINEVQVHPAIIKAAHKKEHLLYLYGEYAFLKEMNQDPDALKEIDNDTDADNIDSEKLAEAKKIFLESYKSVYGRDFDFETWLSHNKTKCPTYGLKSNVVMPDGLDVELDTEDVKEFYGLRSKKSGDTICFADKEIAVRSAEHFVRYLTDSEKESPAAVYTLLHFKDGVIETE